MSEHTKEPWGAVGGITSVDRHCDEYVGSIKPPSHGDYRGEICRLQSCNCVDGISDVEAMANATRIVACVNALADIPDPAAFMADVREHLAECKVRGSAYFKVETHLKGGTNG